MFEASLFQHSNPFEATWDEAIKEAKELEKLEDNWDGEGSPPPKPMLVESALNLFKVMQEQNLSAPCAVYCVGDGTVFAEWHYENPRINVSIDIRKPGEGEILVYRGPESHIFKKISW